MKETRKVDFLSKIGFLKRSPILALLGSLFTLLPILIVLMISILSSVLDMGLPNVDYDKVFKGGTQVSGELVDIETQNTISVNGQHPSILTFTFKAEGESRQSRVQALEPNRVAYLNVGDRLDVKYLDNEAILVGFRPYAFSEDSLFIIPIPFLIIGLPILIFLLIRLSKEIKLYKEGELKEGEILAMTVNSGLPVTNIGQSVSVHYQYRTRNGTKMMGKSKTTDFAILSDKKKGESVKILVLPTNESKSCLYPELVAMKNNWKN